MRAKRLVASLLCILLWGFVSARPALAASQAATQAFGDTINASDPVPPPETVANFVLADAIKNGVGTDKCVPSDAKVLSTTPHTGTAMAIHGITAGQIKNLWMVKVEFLGCKNSNVENYNLIKFANYSFGAYKFVRGGTITSHSLYNDSLLSLYGVLGAFEARSKISCDVKAISIVDTSVTSKSPDLGQDIYGVRFQGSWQEAWQVDLCGVPVEVLVEFVSDGDGGARFTFAADKIKTLK